MTKLDITKRVASFIVGVGTTQIVNAICINNTQPTKLTDKVTVTAGAVVLGMIAADVTRKYTDAKIQDIADWYNANIKN
jgi:uncharacterized membrane protein YebE (DUF533 family)